MKLSLDLAFATAVDLGGLGTGAAAAPVDLSSGSAGFMSTPGNGGFSDVYTFTLASTTTVNVLLGSVVGGSQNVDFSNVFLTGPAGQVTAAAFTGDPYESWVIGGASLGPGAVGSIALSPNGSTPPSTVPEPGTSALLLVAGLAAAHATGRRRRRAHR